MKCITFLYLMCTCFFISLSLFAQDKGCKEDIHRFYVKSATLSYEKGYHAKYGVQTMYKDKDMSSEEQVFNLYAKNKQVYVLNDKVSTYADTLHLITVSHLTKKIMITRSSPKYIEQLSTQSTLLNDSLLWKNFKIISCTSIANHKAYNKQVVLQAKKQDATVKQMTYWYKKEASSLYKVTTVYADASPLNELSYTFYNIDHHYKGTEINSKNAYRIFFDANGKLLPAYKNYEIIDQRNSKKNN